MQCRLRWTRFASSWRRREVDQEEIATDKNQMNTDNSDSFFAFHLSSSDFYLWQQMSLT